MRKFKCIELNQTNGFTEGNIYEIGDDGIIHYDSGNPCLAGVFRINGDKAECWWSKFEEVFDDKGEGEKMSKFKAGDMVRIIKNGTHCFEKGDIVELYEINERKDMLRGKQKGNSRDFGNWIEFNEMELIKESTFTITTSDTITTLTDGTHITSINRYYTDKHDDMVALEEVVKKYKSEIEDVDRVNKIPKVGDKVRVIDSDTTYPTYYKWFFENKINDECAMKWQYDRCPNEREGTFRVVSLGKHNIYDDMIALITDDNHTYLINVDGLEVVK